MTVISRTSLIALPTFMLSGLAYLQFGPPYRIEIPSLPKIKLNLTAPRAPIQLTPVYSIPPEHAQKSIAITVDAEGGSSQDMARLLKSLKVRKSKATFFICGNWAPYNYPNIKKMVADGHEIGNHTLTHKFGPKLSDNDLKLELIYLETAINKHTGLTTKPLFRPPYGATSPKGRQIIKDLGYKNILWNVDIRDALKPYPSYETMLARLIKVHPGSIVLMHSVRKETLNALIAALPYYKEKGIKLVTVSELIEIGDAGHKKALAKKKVKMQNKKPKAK